MPLAILKFLTLFTELFPIVHSAVQLVEQAAPASTPGAQKFDAALTAVNSAISAAPAAAADIQTAKAASASGDTAGLATSIGHMIELSVSISKTFGLFQKAGIVQNAKTLEHTANISPPTA